MFHEDICTVNISKLNYWLVICIAKKLNLNKFKDDFLNIWFFLHPQIPDFQILSDHNKPYINGKFIYSAFRWCIHLNFVKLYRFSLSEKLTLNLLTVKQTTFIILTADGANAHNTTKYILFAARFFFGCAVSICTICCQNDESCFDSDSVMPVKRHYFFSYESVLDFCARAPSVFEDEWNIQRVIVFSAPWCSHHVGYE